MSTKDAKALARKMRKLGWDVCVTGSGHYKLTPPDGGEAVIMPVSPSDYRSLRNTVAHLRRQGAAV